MATQVKITFDSQGFADILAQPGVRSLVEEQTRKIAMQAGDGMAYEVTEKSKGRPSTLRPVGYVWTDTYEARVAEAEDRALTKAVR